MWVLWTPPLEQCGTAHCQQVADWVPDWGCGNIPHHKPENSHIWEWLYIHFNLPSAGLFKSRSSVARVADSQKIELLAEKKGAKQTKIDPKPIYSNTNKSILTVT